MKVDKLKDYYNKIDACSIELSTELDFDYIQSQIVKTAMITEELNRMIGEILVEHTRLEHEITDRKFEYELKFTKYLMDNAEVKKLSTSKERKDYVNYFIMKDEYRSFVDLEQEYRDVEKLLDFAKKKSRDIDRVYPKLKTMWDTYSSEMKNIKKIGSDAEYINKVRNDINDDNANKKPLFSDNIVEELKDEQYDNTEDSIEVNDNLAELNNASSQSIEDEVDDLLADL